MSTSRETARDALVTLLAAALVGEGLPAKTVSGSKITSLEGISPLVAVLSRGSVRTALTTSGDQAGFFFTLQSWVLQSDGGDWSYADAEDALDSIEALIAGVCEDNDRTANWELLRYDGPSSIVAVAVAGVPYYLESIPIQVVLGRN